MSATSWHNAVLIIGATNSLSLLLTAWLYYLLSITNQEKERFQTIIESIQIPLSITHLEDGKILYANEPMGATLGTCSQNLRKEQAVSFDRNATEWPILLDKLAENGYIHNHEIRVRKADGAYFSALISAELIEFKGEQAIVSTFCDITEYKQVESALRESEALFHTIANSAPVLMYMSDEDTLCTFFNQPWLDFTGRSLEQELGNGWMEGIHPEDLEYFRDNYLSTCSAYNLFRLEYRLRRADGQYRWVLCTGVPHHTTEGSFAGYICSCIDITDRKEAEEERRRSEARYRAIVEDQTELICRFRPDGSLLFVNETYCRYFGKKQQELIESNFCCLSLDQNRQQIEKYIVALTSDDPVVTNEEMVTIANQESYWLQWINRGIFSEQGELVELQAVGRDITERKRTEEVLREHQLFVERIADATPGILYIYDLIRQRHVYTNQQIAELLGYTPTQVQEMGSNFTDQVIYPADLPKYQEYIQQRIPQAKDGEILEFDYRVRHASGERRWLQNRDTVFIRNELGCPIQIIGVAQDITKRKQAESALQASEERLRVALEAAGMSSWEWNLLTDQITWSGNFDFFSSMLPSRFDGKHETFIESIHSPDRPRVLEALENAVNDGEDYDVEFRVILPDGNVRWVASKGQVFYGETGFAVRMVGVDMDITRHKLAEEELQRSEELYRTMARNFPNGAVLLFDKNLHYTLAEGKGLADFGLSKELIEGKTITEVFPPEIWHLKQKADQESLEGKSSVFEMSYGKRIYLVHVLPVKNDRGEIFAGMAMWQDISDRKRAELALLEERNFISAILNTANAIILVLDPEGRIHRFNRFCEKLTGYTFEEVKGKFAWDLFLLKDDIEPVKAVVRELQSGKFANEYENYWVARDGTRRLLSWSNTVLLDADGSVKYVVAIAIDVTERKKAEKARQALERERELSQLRLRFFSMASHEFRTPLSTILMSAQLLGTCSDTWSQEKKARNLQRIESATKHMIQLLEDILMINRAETRKLELQPAQINLSKFCWHLVEEIQLNAAPNQQVVYNCKCRCHNAYIDEKVLRSILSNLLSNAIKYSSDGSDVYLDLTCDNGQATLKIQDQGIGIPDSDQPLLFEAFHRGGNIDKIGGTGLGLTVVKHCLQLCGGSISFKSKVGVGTTFTVQIPLNQDRARDLSSEP
ncbi:MAG: PAS domain S-box protein [Coleofasciculaceae cyanobacterium]